MNYDSFNKYFIMTAGNDNILSDEVLLETGAGYSRVQTFSFWGDVTALLQPIYVLNLAG